MTIFHFALLRGIRNPLSMVVNCMIPLIIILIRPFWTGGDIAGFGNLPGFGLLAFTIMGGAFLMSQSILSDKVDGAIMRILAAPVTMRRYLAENLLSCMVPLVIQIALISLLGFILYDWSLALSFALFLCYTVLALSSVAMAFAWHCLFKSKENSNTGFSLVLTLMMMLGGVFIPIEILPGFLEYAGVIFPVYWAMQGIRSVLETGTMLTEYWLGIAAILLFAIAFLLYGGKRRII